MLDRQHRIRHPRSHSAPARALDDLRFIRETLERSSAFTAIPGWGQVAMGASALPAAWLAARQSSPSLWLTVWLVEAVFASSLGIAATQNKAQRAGVPLTSGPGRKFALSFLPAAVAGAVLTFILYQAGMVRFLPGTWLLLFGAGVVSAGALSVAIVPAMGTLSCCWVSSPSCSRPGAISHGPRFRRTSPRLRFQHRKEVRWLKPCHQLRPMPRATSPPPARLAHPASCPSSIA